MAYALPNFTNTSGIEEVLQYGSQQVPILVPGLLFMIYIIILVSGYFSQERKTGQGNFLMWASIAGLITTSGAFMLFLYDNLVNMQTIMVCVVITIISAFAFLINQRE